MADTDDDFFENEPVLICAPVGRDAALIGKMLTEAGMRCRAYADPGDLRERLDDPLGGLVLTEEALTPAVMEVLAEALKAQPAWSDLPVVLFVSAHGQASGREGGLAALEAQANVTILERPVSTRTLVTAVRAALRARRRQYEVRDLLARLEELNDTLEERVEERTGQVRRLASTLTEAEQHERRRISQILHDHIQQILYGAELNARQLRRRATRPAEERDEKEWMELLDQLETLLDDATEATKTLAVELSPPVLKDEGLEATFQWLAEHMEERHGLTVEIDPESACRVPDEDLRELLYQGVRELLFNVVKHAGVRRARLSFSEEAGQCLLRVADDGSGFDVEAAWKDETRNEGLGLFRLKNRLELLGGRLDIDTAPGRGTRMMLVAPLRTDRPPAAES